MSGDRTVVRHIGRLTTWAQPVIENGAVVVIGGRVSWIGRDSDLPAGIADCPEVDAGGAAVLPGFVDCHTHAVWAGDRRADFVARIEGGAYQPEGIGSTVAATSAAATEDLITLTSDRLRRMRHHGATTVEIKSGYGLTPDAELRLLDVAAMAAAQAEVTTSTTYLGAHVVPPGRNRDEYVDEVVATLPVAKARGADWCDVFCDDGAFTIDETRRILTAATDCGLGIRMHAEQLANTGASQLAAELGCASADHLDNVSADDARALAAADVVGVLVPAASLYTRSERWSHGQVLRDAGVTLAIATDCNPGSAHNESMPLAIQLACLQMGLGVEEALRAATLGGARALRRDDIGHLRIGARADLIVLTSDHEVDVVARLGVPAVAAVVREGSAESAR